MVSDLINLEADIHNHRPEIIRQLSDFIHHDTLLFWSDNKELYEKQKTCWLPVLQWINQTYNTEFVYTTELSEPKENSTSVEKLNLIFANCSDKELTALYMFAKIMRSVLLALALIRGKIKVEQAFELSELEELYQAARWGHESFAEARRKEMQNTLLKIESYINQ